MGLGVFYTTGDSEKAIRRYWRGWSVEILELVQTLNQGQVIFRLLGTCEVSILCDRCGRWRCIGCGATVSIDISGGKEEVTCIPRCGHQSETEA